MNQVSPNGTRAANPGAHTPNSANGTPLTFTFSRFTLLDKPRGKQGENSWSELCEEFSQCDIRPEKDGPLFSPAIYDPKKVYRAKENVWAVSALVGDCDESHTLFELRAIVKPFGCRAIIVSTHSHGTIKDANAHAPGECYRVIFLLETPIDAADYPDVWERFNRLFGGAIDASCKNLARAYYWPSHPTSIDFVFEVFDGDYLSIDRLPALPEAPPVQDYTPEAGANGTGKPGTDFNSKATNEDTARILEAHGWRVKRADGQRWRATRPGKTGPGISGTIGHYGPGVLHVFSSNANPFESGRAYPPFKVMALLEYNGDWSATAKALAARGYGEKRRRDYQPTEPTAANDGTGNEADEPEKLKIMLGYPTTDTGNAERFIYQHGQKFLYSAALGWMYFDGTRWTRDELGRVASWEKQTVRSIYAEANAADDDDERKALSKWATKSESAATRKAMMENVIKDGPRAIPADFDRDKMLLNVANGTLDLRTGELRPHFQGDRISKICGVRYDPRATCPMYLDSLGMIFNNSDEVIRFIQRAIGYSLTGLTREQCLFIMHGSGANGKSLLLKIISALMGDYWKHAAASALMQKRGDAIPNDVAMLNGARLVTAIESNEGRKFDEATVKAATGDDPLTARFFRKEFFTFTPEFKIFLATNHKPQIVGTDDGIWRRIRMIPFNVRFWDGDKGETGPAHLRADKSLGEKILANELSGVLNWALAGCMEYLECGLPSPEAVKGATNAYREEMDPVSQFIDECAVKDDELMVLKGDFHKAFSRWLKDCDAPSMTALSLSLRMKEKGFLETRGTGGVRKWAGIALITPDTDGTKVTGSKKEERKF